MKLRRIIAALGAGLLVLGSCQGPEPEEPVLPAALTTPVLQLEPASGSVYFMWSYAIQRNEKNHSENADRRIAGIAGPGVGAI